MTLTLFNEARATRIADAIRANRAEAATLVSDRSPEAAARMRQLNAAWVELEQAKQQTTGIDPAPYTFRGA